MTEVPIDLDGRRTAEGKLEIQMRRRAANTRSWPQNDRKLADAKIDAALLAEPAGTLFEAIENARFLLEHYSATPQAQDVRIQKLIARALSDLARLKNREENAK